MDLLCSGLSRQSKFWNRSFGIVSFALVILVVLFINASSIDKIRKLTLFTKLRSYNNKSDLPLNLFGSSNCRPMITLNSDGNFNSNYTSLLKDIRNLEFARQGNPVSYSSVISNLGKYLSKIYHINLIDQDDIDQRKPTTTVNEVHYTHWPYVPCEAHKYEASEVKTCWNFYQNKTSKPLRISFVGDSMIREIMKRMVLFLKKDLQLKYQKDERHANIETEFEKGKFKSNVVIIGEGIELRFYWASYLENYRNPNDETPQGAKDLLQNWLVGKNLDADPLPDILIIGSGAWLSLLQVGITAIDEFVFMVQEIFVKLRKLSRNIRVLWHVHPIPGWRQETIRLQHQPSVLDWMNQIAYLNTKGSDIWFWDTLAVFISRERKECTSYQIINHLLPHSWGCQDSVHPGEAGTTEGANMIFNIACNHILNFKQKCCS